MGVGLMLSAGEVPRIAGSFGWAEKAGLSFSFATSHVGGEHPNTARVDLVGRSGKTLSMTGSSLGGGRIMVVEMNGLRANFSGDLPTLIVQNIDQPGHVNEVTGMLTKRGIQHKAAQPCMGIALGFQPGVKVVQTVCLTHRCCKAVLQPLADTAQLRKIFR